MGSGNEGARLPVYPLLALLWAIVLVPPMVRGRVRHRSELAEFDRIRLCFVGSTDVADPQRDESSAPAVRRTAAQRRRRVLAVLGVSIVATLVVAVLVGSRAAWGVHLLAYDVLIAYVGLLARSRDRQVVRPTGIAPVSNLLRPEPMPAVVPVLLQAASR